MKPNYSSNGDRMHSPGNTRCQVGITKLSVLIPVYNEELNIPVLYARLTPILQKLNLTYEIVFINDGSSDRSIELIKALALSDPAVRFISFSRNFGHQIAVCAGLDMCRGDAIAIIDADLQDPPELLELMYNKLQEGFENVYAKRRSRKDKSLIKKFAYRFFYRLLARISQVEIPLDTGDYRVMTRQMAEVIKLMPERNKFLRGQIAWAGYRQTYVEYDRDMRAAGEPGYTYAKLFRLAFDGITGFSNIPLRVATISGFLVFFSSIALMSYLAFGYFVGEGDPPQGWTSLMTAILFVGGIQLLSFGIIGEYIGRLQADIRQRPLYVVKETNFTKDISPVPGH